MFHLTALTWNVNGSKLHQYATYDKETKTKMVAEEIKSQDADVVAVQEGHVEVRGYQTLSTHECSVMIKSDMTVLEPWIPQQDLPGLKIKSVEATSTAVEFWVFRPSDNSTRGQSIPVSVVYVQKQHLVVAVISVHLLGSCKKNDLQAMLSVVKPGCHCIIMGDMNMMRKHDGIAEEIGMKDAAMDYGLAKLPYGQKFTWDTCRNHFFGDIQEDRHIRKDRIYFRTGQCVKYKLVGDKPDKDNAYLSDHFGVLAVVRFHITSCLP